MATTCWICGDNADSGEHMLKASDIRSRFGRISNKDPIFIHTKEKRNERVSGLKSNLLKYSDKLCQRCNNHRTQPYDLAWEALSGHLSSRNPPIKAEDRIRLQKIFPGSVRKSMLNVHLYFVKVFGCKIVEGGAPLDLSTFSSALLTGTPHAYIHIALCPRLIREHRVLGISEIYAAKDQRLGRMVYGTCFYHLDTLNVRIVYAEPQERREGLLGTWHPSSVRKYLKIASNAV